jgi:hypothetical protein
MWYEKGKFVKEMGKIRKAQEEIVTERGEKH